MKGNLWSEDEDEKAFHQGKIRSGVSANTNILRTEVHLNKTINFFEENTKWKRET